MLDLFGNLKLMVKWFEFFFVLGKFVMEKEISGDLFVDINLNDIFIRLEVFRE